MSNYNPILKPEYYQKHDGGVECFEAIRDSMSEEAYRGYIKGNIIKYIWRYEEKGGIEDLEKCEVYLGVLMNEVDDWARDKDFIRPEVSE